MKREQAKERFIGYDVDAMIVKAARKTRCNIVMGDPLADGNQPII
jgi:hypothetical protein